MFRLETIPRISKVTTFQLAPAAGAYPNLQLTIQVNFYTTDVSAGPARIPATVGGGCMAGWAMTVSCFGVVVAVLLLKYL